MSRVITIGREFGSGGHEVGLKLSEKLGIPFYDKLLVSMVAEEGDFAPEYLHEMEEKVELHIAPFLATRSSYSVYQQPMSDKIFFRQADIIRRLAAEGPCVIVGRCSDYVLEHEKVDALHVFLHAKIEDRIARKLRMDTGIAVDNMERHIKATDRRRAKYYRHYTGRVWGARENYHLCLNTSYVGIDGAVDTIITYLNDMKPASRDEIANPQR